MKKNSIIFCVALAAFGVQAFGFMEGNEPKTNAINKRITGIRYASSFCNATGPAWETSQLGPYLPMDLVKEATYEGGMEALMKYLEENSREARAGQEMDKLQPFKLVFTVTKKGAVENVKLDGTSGYYAIDYRMIHLMLKAPGKWEPAENAKGEKVDQEQVVPLGPTGC